MSAKLVCKGGSVKTVSGKKSEIGIILEGISRDFSHYYLGNYGTHIFRVQYVDFKRSQEFIE